MEIRAVQIAISKWTHPSNYHPGQEIALTGIQKHSLMPITKNYAFVSFPKATVMIF